MFRASHRSVALVAFTAITLAGSAGIAASSLASAKPKVYDGPDVSSYQHPGGKAINWKSVRKAGKDFAIVKATESTYYTNPWFSADYAGSLKAGLVHGSYAFARPSTPVVSSAVSQAQHYADVIGSVRTTHTLPPVLDLEVTGGLSRPQLVTWAQTFLLEMHALTGRVPMLYTYPYFWSSDLDDRAAFARYPLWMAAYGTSQAPSATLWQFTDDAHIKGISGGVDESKLLTSSAKSWARLTNGTTATPWVASAPGAPVDVSASPASGAATVSWLPADTGSSGITSYTVTAQPGDHKVTVSGATTRATVPHLTDGKAYRFSVTAHNSVGTSAASALSGSVVPTVPTAITGHVSVHTDLYHGPVTVSGVLRRTDSGKPVVGGRVLVYRHFNSGGSWTQRASLTTDAHGAVSVVLHPAHNLEYELVYPGATGTARSQVFEHVVVRPIVTAVASATTVQKKHAVTISGTISPAVDHQAVEREAYSDGHWQVVGLTHASQHGTYHFSFKPTKSEVYRVVAKPVHDRSSGYSSHIALTVD